jgi:gas vesicle protein
MSRVNVTDEEMEKSSGGGMAYEYDRLEREEGGGSFLMGLLAGTVLGAGLGMLFAPKPGSELRSQLTESAGKLRSSAGDTYQQASEKVSQMVDRGRDAYDRARSSVSNMASTGTTGASGNTGTGSTGSSGYTNPTPGSTSTSGGGYGA